MHSHFRYTKGGAEYQVLLIAQELAKLKYDIHFIFLKEAMPVDKNKERPEGQMHPIIKTLVKELSTLKVSYLFDVYSQLKKIEPDVIYHRNLSPFLFVATEYAKSRNIKTILHISASKDVERFRLWARDRSLLKGIDDYFKYRGLKQVKLIIAQTYEQQFELQKNYGRKSVVVRNMVEQVPSVNPKNKEQIIVWIANVKPIKNPLQYIELSNALADTGYRFLMIGRPPSGKFGEEFHKRIARSKIEYLGERTMTEVENILEKAKILCCTSYAEGFSNTFIQAWARQVPVVSLYVDPDQILMKEKIGIKSASFDEFVRSVNVLMQDQFLRDEMGKRATEYVKHNHSIEINLNKILSVIQS